MIIQRLTFVAAALSIFAAAPAFAQIGVSADVYGAASSVGVDASAAVGNPASANKASSSAGSDSAYASTTMNGSYNTLNGGTNGGAAADLHAFTISRGDLQASTTAYVSATNVSTSDDLRDYSRALMMSDDNVAKIEADDSQVSVWYHEPAKFLGIVPVTVTVRATVDAGGNVDVAYPWWYSLFVKDETQAAFESDLNSTAGTLAKAEATTTLSSSAKARLVNALQSILKSRYQSASATSSAETRAY
ncbi:MAG TPA: hypothetical protein VFQ72_01280 [Candidatus Paceibacterota bacterium]|nr:hypothetical protein [Candidatus Paceibacterota bacterium]